MRINRRHVGWTLVGLGIVAIVSLLATAAVIGAVNSTLIRQSQVTNTSTLNNSNRVLQLIEDCTRPGGECYERGRESTASAVSDIGRVTVLAAACSASLDDEALTVPQRADLIQRCIVANLDRDH